MPCPNKKAITAYVTAEEFAAVEAEIVQKFNRRTTKAKTYHRREAECGSEKALAVLRSDPATLAKTADEVTRDSLAQQRAILGVDEMPARQRRALVDVTKLQEILAKDALAGDSALTLQGYDVDGRGVVRFQLSNGTTIRDTGRELRFTPGDMAVAKLAKAFALAKWGQMFRLEGDGRAVFDKEVGREKERPIM